MEGSAASMKAYTLVEALPYIKKFYGTTVVVKYGGSTMGEQELGSSIVTDVVLMKYVGMNPILIHGGGREISQLMARLGKEPVFVDGLRVTDAETVEIAEMVLAGKVNKALVKAINSEGGQAIGLSGNDGGLIIAARRRHRGRDGQPVDLGFVGDVKAVNPSILKTLCDAGYIPVVAPVAAGEDGHTYNINADTVAGEIARAMKADKLVILTDVEGIHVTDGGQKRFLSTLTRSQAEVMIAEGSLNGGMIPKVRACLRALPEGVAKAHIINGNQPHSLLLEIFTDQGVGTMVTVD